MTIAYAQTSTPDIVERSDPFYLDRLQQILGLGGDDPRVIIARLIQAFLSVLGIIFLLLVLKAGVLWMISGADDERRGSARRTLVSAIIGTGIILASYSIVRFIINALAMGTAVPTF